MELNMVSDLVCVAYSKVNGTDESFCPDTFILSAKLEFNFHL